MKVKVIEALSYPSALPQWLKSICLTNAFSLAIFFFSSLSVKSCSLPLSFTVFFAEKNVFCTLGFLSNSLCSLFKHCREFHSGMLITSCSSIIDVSHGIITLLLRDEVLYCKFY